MKQQLLKTVVGVMILPLVLGTLTGCAHKGNVKFFVHGGVGTVIEPQGRAIVIVPRDDKKEHVLIFPEPTASPLLEAGPCQVTYKLALKGVEPVAGEPSINPDFKPVIFHVSDWKRKDDDDYFVTLDLPGLRAIDVVGPLERVRFASNPLEDKYAPIIQMLTFTARDISKVKLEQIKVTKCGAEKPVIEPVGSVRALKCREMREKYEEYFKRPEKHINQSKEHALSRPYLRHELSGCTDDSVFLFMGIGLPEGTDEDALELHAVNFFNKKLLAVVYGSEAQVPAGRKRILQPPEKVIGNLMQSPQLAMLQPAVFHPSGFRSTPKLLMIPAASMFASTENCSSPGVIITTGHP